MAVADKRDGRLPNHVASPQATPLRTSAPKTPYCVPLLDGVGVIGFGDDEPEPSVVGGVAVWLTVLGL